MNKQNVWERLIEDKENDDLGCYGEQTSDSEIKVLESSLKLNFSQSYRKFISLFGSALLPGQIIYGSSYLEEMGSVNKNVVEKTKFYKNYQKWPDIDDWIIISDDGSGNPIGIKPDGSVWLSDHDSNFEQIKLANDFEDFLEKLLDETLYE